MDSISRIVTVEQLLSETVKISTHFPVIESDSKSRTVVEVVP